MQTPKAPLYKGGLKVSKCFSTKQKHSLQKAIRDSIRSQNQCFWQKQSKIKVFGAVFLLTAPLFWSIMNVIWQDLLLGGILKWKK